MQIRLKIISLGFLFSILGILGRLYHWQVVKSSELAAQAKAQHTKKESIDALRGNIFAADESILSSTSVSWLVYAALPELKDDPKTIANQLAMIWVPSESDEEGYDYQRALFDEAVRLEGLLSKEDVSWIALKDRVSDEIKSNIAALGVGGIGFEPQQSRLYPEASSAAHLLGFVGKDEEGGSTGYFGLEGFYDLTLAGKPGFRQRESSALGIPLLSGLWRSSEAIAGVDLVTHIDKTVQFMVEQSLQSAIESYGAKSGVIIVMRPSDGAILGLASYPSFDPSIYWEYGDQFFKNPAISDSFEPGSIFKPLVMAAGIDAGEVEPDTKCDICHEPLKVGKYTIGTWNDEYQKDATMTEVIVHSDNVGMSFVGLKLGKNKMYQYLSDYGLGQKTGIDLQGEASPSLREKNGWGDIDVATASFGQGIAVTPIQMITAMSAIAGDGKVVYPQVVDKLKINGWEQDLEPRFGKQVISHKAASQVAQMMVAAAKEGEAKWTAVQGFEIAGKTGTAQIPVSGHYDAEKTIASFIGFAPASDPKFLMLVTLREPESSPWASETAAPLWFAIAKKLFPYLGVQPE